MHKKFFFLGLALLFIFAVLSRAVKYGFLRQTDFDTTVRLQNRIPARFDQIWDDGAILADPVVSFGLAIALTAWAWKKRKMRALIIPLGFLLVAAIELYGKTTLPHPGPPYFFVKHPTTVFPKFTVIEPFSYPSGHTARITFLALIAWIFARKRAWAGFAMLGYVVFIGLGRMYLGQHWLSDVLGGALLGSGFGIIVVTLL